MHLGPLDSHVTVQHHVCLKGGVDQPPPALGTERASAPGTQLSSHHHNPPAQTASADLPGTFAELLLQETKAYLIPLTTVAWRHPTFKSGWFLPRIFELSDRQKSLEALLPRKGINNT